MTSMKNKLRERIEKNIKTKGSGGNFGRGILSYPENVKFYKPKVGTNRVEIIPYEVSSKNHPQGYHKGEPDYLLDLFAHRRIGVTEDNIICLKHTYGKACPICEEISELKKDYEKNEDLIKSLRPSRRVIYNIFDHEDEEVKLFETSHYLFEKELLEEAACGDNGEVVVFADAEEGKTIRFRATEEEFGKNTYLKFKSFKFLDREEKLTNKVLSSAYKLDEFLVVLTYEEIKNIFYGHEIEEDTEEKQDTVKAEKKRSPEPKEKCPQGHTFGEDCDEHDECCECKIWEDCSEASEK